MASLKKTITYYYRGGVERGNGRSYDWHDGYSENSPEGLPLYPLMTWRECRHEAKSRGAVAVFEREVVPAEVSR